MKRINLIFGALTLFACCNITVTAQTVKLLNLNVRMSGQMVGYSAVPFANYIKQYDPDFITLQEVDFKTTRNGMRDFTTELAAELLLFGFRICH